MDFAGFKDWVFLGLLSGGVYLLWQLKESVQHLNVQIAVVIERTDGHERRIERLENAKV